MTLSKTQEGAVSKLSDEWQDAYTLRESMATLQSLVRRNLAETKGQTDLGALLSPQTTIKFRLKEEVNR